MICTSATELYNNLRLQSLEAMMGVVCQQIDAINAANRLPMSVPVVGYDLLSIGSLSVFDGLGGIGMIIKFFIVVLGFILLFGSLLCGSMEDDLSKYDILIEGTCKSPIATASDEKEE